MSDKRLNNKNVNKSLTYVDPELEAEATVAKELGLPIPTQLAADIIREKKLRAEAEANLIRKHSVGNKTTKAQRKVCNRGVCGAKTRKDSFKLQFERDDVDYDFDVENGKDDTFVDEEDFVHCNSNLNNSSHVIGAIRDYFVNGCVEEAIASIDNYAVTKDDIYLAIKQAIVGLLGLGLNKIKAASVLICELVRSKKASVSNVMDMLNEMLMHLEHLLVDYPTAAKALEQLLARLVYDKLLTTDDLEDIQLCVAASNNVKIDQVCFTAIGYSNDADVLRDMFEFDGAEEPLEVLDAHFVDIISGYFETYDAEDSMRRLKAFGVPHYHHAFVFQTLLFAAKADNEKKANNIVGLLKKMLDNGFLTLTSIEVGFRQFIGKLVDHSNDIPNIYATANYITHSAMNSGLVSSKSGCYYDADKYKPLEVDARLLDRLEDEGVGSLSSNASSDEDTVLQIIA